MSFSLREYEALQRFRNPHTEPGHSKSPSFAFLSLCLSTKLFKGERGARGQDEHPRYDRIKA